MSRIESIRRTCSQGRPASLNKARRALVNPALRSVVLGSRADSLGLREQVAMASDAHAGLDAAAMPANLKRPRRAFLEKEL